MDKPHTDNAAVGAVEKQIETWRAHLRKSPSITSQDDCGFVPDASQQQGQTRQIHAQCGNSQCSPALLIGG